MHMPLHGRTGKFVFPKTPFFVRTKADAQGAISRLKTDAAKDRR